MKSSLSVCRFCCLCFSIIAKNHCPIQGQICIYVSFEEFYSLTVRVRSLIHFEFIFICGVRKDQTSFFDIWISSVPAPFVEKTVFSVLNGLGSLVKNQLGRDVWVYFLTLSSVPLLYMCIIIIVITVGIYHGPHYFDYCRSVISFEVMRCGSSFVLFQDCFNRLGTLAFPYEFQSLFSLFLQKKKKSQDFNRDHLESVGQFRECSYYKCFSSPFFFIGAELVYNVMLVPGV